MIAIDTIRAMFSTITDGTDVTVTKTNGNAVTGNLLRIRDKSITLVVDGKNVHINLVHIASVEVVPAADDTDLLTTAEFAAIFDTNAKALRVQLRRLGLGVGKGSRYGLPRSLATTHGDAIRAGLAADAEKRAAKSA